MMNCKKISILLTCTLFSILAIGQVESRSYYADKGLVPREHSVDYTHLKLEVSFVPEEGLVKGKVKHTFTVLQQHLDTLFLDGVRMTFKEVLLDGKAVKYDKSAKGITLRFDQELIWGSEHQLNISYEANPTKGIYFVGWQDESNRSRKQIWTQGQGINNRHWIPMFDEKNDKVISEIIVDFDEKYQVLSNGSKLKEKSIGDGQKRWHYKISQPHPTYLIMLGIGDYAIEKSKSASGVPLQFYYYPDQAEQMVPTYRFSKRMFDFFEKEIGVPYPWKSYSQIPVQDFMYGAMENTTATIFGDFYLVDERSYIDKNYVRVNAHELAHQWFGDLVTARSAAHHWLQESFATHYDLMYQGEAFGKDYMDWVRRNYNNQALNASKKDLKPIAHSAAGTVRHYPKGAFVLQMLKYVVGREQYNAAIKYYLEKHAYGNVDSKNLLVAFHDRLGLSLNWFWEQWVYKGGEPHYDVRYQSLGEKGIFNVKQVHQQNDLVGLFRMPIQFEIHFKDGSKTAKKVWIEKESQQVEMEIGDKAVDFVLFDPNNEVMKKVNFNKPLEMLKSQAKNAEFMLDRYDAFVALGQHSFESKISFYMEQFEKESFHAIKGEIIHQLLPQLDETAEKMMVLGINDADVEVRKAVLNNTLRIPLSLRPEYAKLLTDSSYQIIEKALELLSFYAADEVEKYLDITQEEMGNRSHNVRIKWLEIAIQNRSDNEDLMKELVDYTSNSFEFTTRINAAKALKALNLLNEEALGNMLNATFSFNRRLAGPVNKVIQHFFEQANYKKMILNYVAEQKWSDAEFKKVRRYLAY